MVEIKRLKYSLNSSLSCTNGNYVNLCKENIIERNKVVEKGECYILFIY